MPWHKLNLIIINRLRKWYTFYYISKEFELNQSKLRNEMLENEAKLK